MAETLRKLNSDKFQTHYRTMWQWIQEYNINTDHWTNRPRESPKITIRSLEEILVENSPYKNGGGSLKRKLLKHNLIKDECTKCGLGNEWQKKPITLHLDHINGIPNDNRLENLRVLCPNCHSQTETFGGKNVKKKKVKNKKKYKYYMCNEINSTAYKHMCINCYKTTPRKDINNKKKQIHKNKKINLCKCGNNKNYRAKQCEPCYRKSCEKIQWLPYEELKKLVEETSYSEAGRRLGVSNNAIKKRLKNHRQQ